MTHSPPAQPMTRESLPIPAVTFASRLRRLHTDFLRSHRTEARVRAAVDELLPGRTEIIVAHKADALRHADWVVILEARRIIAQGRPEELFAADEFSASTSRLPFAATLRVLLNCFSGNGTNADQGLATVSSALNGRVPCCRPRFFSRRRCRACLSFRRRSSFRSSA
jgi:hypothetical protein